MTAILQSAYFRIPTIYQESYFYLCQKNGEYPRIIKVESGGTDPKGYPTNNFPTMLVHMNENTYNAWIAAGYPVEIINPDIANTANT